MLKRGTTRVVVTKQLLPCKLYFLGSLSSKDEGAGRNLSEQVGGTLLFITRGGEKGRKKDRDTLLEPEILSTDNCEGGNVPGGRGYLGVFCIRVSGEGPEHHNR